VRFVALTLQCADVVVGLFQLGLEMIVVSTQLTDDLDGAVNALFQTRKGIDALAGHFSRVSRHDGYYGLLNLGLMSFFCPGREGCESGGIVHCYVSEDLTVQFDSGAFQAIDELAVADSNLTASRINAHDPEGTEVTLFQPTADVSIPERLFDCFLRCAVQLRLGEKVTLRAA
jgi:hypothetical protein